MLPPISGSSTCLATWLTTPRPENPIAIDTETARLLVKQIIDRTATIQMLSAGASWGKNHVIETEARKAGLKRPRDWDYVNPDSRVGLYNELYRCRNRRFIALNENERLASDPEMVNMVKVATDPNPRLRVLSRSNARMRQADEQLAPDDQGRERFIVRCAIIWLTNVDYSNDAKLPVGMLEHIDALDSRGMLRTRYRSGTPQQQSEQSLWLILQEDFLRNRGLRLDDAQAVLQTFVKNAPNLATLMPRTVDILAGLRRTLNRSANLTEQVWQANVEAKARRSRPLTLTLPIEAAGNLLPWCRITPPSSRYQHPEPQPQPDSQPEPLPDPDPETDPQADPEPASAYQPSLSRVIDEIYMHRRNGTLTPEIVVAELQRAAPFTEDEARFICEQLGNASNWEQIADAYTLVDLWKPVFLWCDLEHVVHLDDGKLGIVSWHTMREQLAPALEQRQADNNRRLNTERLRELLNQRLPPKRKHKNIYNATWEILELLPNSELKMGPEAHTAMAAIQSMRGDDDRFADCKTVRAYIEHALSLGFGEPAAEITDVPADLPAVAD